MSSPRWLLSSMLCVGALAALPLGCTAALQAVLSDKPDEGESGPVTSGGAGGTGGGAPACECVPDPAGAPVVRAALGTTEACPTGWGPPKHHADGNDPGCAPCGPCSTNMSACSAELTVWESSQCGSESFVTSIEQGDCLDVDAVSGASSYDILAKASGYEATASGSVGTCVAAAPEKGPLAGALTTCAAQANSFPSCGADGVCVPPGDETFSAVCVLVDAAGECPGEYPVGRSLHEIEVDSRACDCACTGSCSQSSLVIHTDSACTTPSGGVIEADAACTSRSNVGQLGNYLSLVVEACKATTTTQGGVQFGPEQKLCCTREPQ